MHSGGSPNGLDHQLRLIIVDSPDVAAPLIDALDVADVGAWMWVEAERALYFSPRVLALLGIARGPKPDLLTRFFQWVHVDDQDQEAEDPPLQVVVFVGLLAVARLRRRGGGA